MVSASPAPHGSDNTSKIVLSVAHHLQHGQAAEAVADRGHLARICVRHLAQLIKAAARSLPQQRSVGCIFHHFGFASFRGVRANALAINVDDEGIEAEVAEHLSAFMGVFTNAAPFRKHKNAGLLDAGIVPDRKSLAFIAVVFVFNDARFEHYPPPGLPIQKLSNG